MLDSECRGRISEQTISEQIGHQRIKGALYQSKMETPICLSSAVHHNITCIKWEVCIKRQPLYSLRFALSLICWMWYAYAVKWVPLLEGIHCIMWPLTYDAVTWEEVGTERRESWQLRVLQWEDRHTAASCGRDSSSGARSLQGFFVLRVCARTWWLI